MAKEIKLQNIELNRFIADEKNKVLAYLRKSFSVLDDDLSDIYQESSVALFVNIRDGKLTNLTSSLSTYFLRICINQTLKFLTNEPTLITWPIHSCPKIISCLSPMAPDHTVSVKHHGRR